MLSIASLRKPWASIFVLIWAFLLSTVILGADATNRTATITAQNTVNKLSDTSITFGGELTVSLSGYTPVAGDTFDLFDFTSNTGEYSDMTLPALSAGLVWDTSTLYTTGVVSVIQTPGNLSVTPIVWVDAKDLPTVITNNSDVVTAWLDKSGNNNHFDNSTGTPDFIQDSNLGNNYVVKFNSEKLTTSKTGLFNGNYDYSLAFLVEYASVDGTQHMFSGDASTKFSLYYPNGNDNPTIWQNTQIINADTAVVANKYYLVFARVDQSAQVKLWVNGDAEGSANVNSNTLASDTGYLQIGGYNTATTLRGNVAEAMLFNSLLSDQDRINLTYSLGQKWGLAASFDSDDDGVMDDTDAGPTDNTNTSVIIVPTDITGDHTFSGTTAVTLYDETTSTAWEISGQATYGGTLALTLDAGYTPAEGDYFKIFTVGSSTGRFSDFTLPKLDSGFGYDLSKLYTDGVITIDRFGVTAHHPVLWMDAQDEPTIIHSSNKVSRWVDGSGSNYDFTQSTAAKKPNYPHSTLNGLPVIEFDGGNSTNAGTNANFDHLNGPNQVIDVSNDKYTMFAVYESDDVGTVSGTNASNAENQALFTQGSASKRRFSFFLYSDRKLGYIGQGGDRKSSLAYSTNTQYISAITRTSDTGIKFFSNNLSPQSTTVASGQNINNNGSIISGRITDNREAFQGKIAEIIILGDSSDDDNITDAEWEAGRAYLARKWKISGWDKDSDGIDDAYDRAYNDANTFWIWNRATESNLNVTSKTLKFSLLDNGLSTSLNITGTLTAGSGTLTIEKQNKFPLASGDTFDIIDGTISGTFSTINLPTLPNTLQWNTSSLYTTGTISVESVVSNSAPVVNAIASSNIYTEANTLTSVTLNITDADSDSLTLNFESSNTSLIPTTNISSESIGSNEYRVTLNPVTDQSGSATITININDGTENTVTTFSFTTHAGNSAPVINAIASSNLNTNINTPISVTMNITDADSDPLTLTFQSTNSVLLPVSNISSINIGNDEFKVTFNPVNNKYGSATITINVSDGDETTVATLSIYVDGGPDTDNDGHPNAFDAFPNDPNLFAVNKSGISLPPKNDTLVLWLNGRHPLGAVPSPNHNSTFKTWIDLSAANNHATAPPGPGAPKFKRNVLAGKGSVAFNNSKMITPTINLTGDYTVIAIAKRNTGGTTDTIMSMANDRNIFKLDYENNGASFNATGYVNQSTPTMDYENITTSNQFNVFVATYKSSSGLKTYVNGYNDSIAVVSTGNTGADNITLGHLLSGDTASQYLNGEIVEIMVYTEALPKQILVNMVRFLAISSQLGHQLDSDGDGINDHLDPTPDDASAKDFIGSGVFNSNEDFSDQTLRFSSGVQQFNSDRHIKEVNGDTEIELLAGSVLRADTMTMSDKFDFKAGEFRSDHATMGDGSEFAMAGGLAVLKQMFFEAGAVGAHTDGRAEIEEMFLESGAAYTLSGADSEMIFSTEFECQAGSTFTMSAGDFQAPLADIKADYNFSGGESTVTQFNVDNGGHATHSGGRQVLTNASITGQYDFSGGELVGDDFYVDPDAVFNVTGGTFDVQRLRGKELFELQGATIKVDNVEASLEVTNAIVAPGDSPGIMYVSGNYTQNAGTTLNIELEGTNAATPEFDQVIVSNNFIINGGVLNVTKINGYQPTSGDSYDIFDTQDGTISGNYEEVLLPTLNAGLAWDLTALYTIGTIAVTDAPGGVSPVAWFDASDPGSIVLNGTDVERWVDKSGNGNDVYQTTASKQPAYGQSGRAINGINVLTFDDGASQSLEGGAIIPDGVKDFTVLMVWEADATPGHMFVWSQNENAAPAGYHGSFLILSSSDYGFIGNGNDFKNHGSLGVPETTKLTGIWRTDAGSNNVKVFTHTTIETGSITNNDIGAEITRIGARSYDESFEMSGEIAEVIIYDSALTNQQIYDARYELAVKWGLTASVDSDNDGTLDASDAAPTDNAVQTDTTNPVISNLASSVSTDEDTEVVVTFNVSDNLTNDGSITFNVAAVDTTLLPQSSFTTANVSGEVTITINPAADQNGSSIVTVNVYDASGNQATSTFNLTVNPIADATVISSTQNGSIAYNTGPGR